MAPNKDSVPGPIMILITNKMELLGIYKNF